MFQLQGLLAELHVEEPGVGVLGFPEVLVSVVQNGFLGVIADLVPTELVRGGEGTDTGTDRGKRGGEEDEEAADLMRIFNVHEVFNPVMQEHEGHAKEEQQRGQPASEPGQRNITSGTVLEIHPLKNETLGAVVVDQLPESLSIGCTRTRRPGDGDLAKLLHPLPEVMSGHLTDPLDGFAKVLHKLREAIVVAPDVRIEQKVELQEPQPFGLVALEQPAGLEGDEQAENHGEQCGDAERVSRVGTSPTPSCPAISGKAS